MRIHFLLKFLFQDCLNLQVSRGSKRTESLKEVVSEGEIKFK